MALPTATPTRTSPSLSPVGAAVRSTQVNTTEPCKTVIIHYMNQWTFIPIYDGCYFVVCFTAVCVTYHR